MTNKPDQKSFLRAFKIMSASVACVVVIGLGAAAGYITELLKGLPKISARTFSHLSQASIVYDIHGKVIGEFSKDGDRQPITSVRQVAPALIQAFIAAEDKTFYHNIGINPPSIFRAAIQNVMAHRIESGFSTITQQTVKLAVFPEQQRTLKRKVQEVALALELNRMLTKDEILTDYMNWVYMGKLGSQNVYGVKKAAEVLFHREPSDLTLAQAAFLAAIPNNPTWYNPYENLRHTLLRQRYILEQMLMSGMIDETEYEHALHHDVAHDLQRPNDQAYKYPYIMMNVEQRVNQALVNAGVYDSVDQADAALATVGYHIYTTIDLDMQRHVDDVLSKDVLFHGTNLPSSADPKKLDLYQAGVTLIDNDTGGIRAMGGGRPNHYSEDELDHTDVPRQPGSAIKPLVVYGPAIEAHKLTAGSILDDTPTVFHPDTDFPYQPKDDEDTWHGLVTARQALVESLNVPAVSVLDDIGTPFGLRFLSRVGIPPGAKTMAGKPTLVPDDFEHLGSAIGGLDNGLTVQQLTSAYTVFPNRGVWRESYLVKAVVDPTGNTIWRVKPSLRRVFSPQTAYIITDILKDVVYRPNGTAYPIGRQLPHHALAGKTGTTDQRMNGWFIGYTPKYTMGLWMGYNHNQSIPKWAYGLKFAVWGRIMAPILRNDPPDEPLDRPDGLIQADICKESGQLATPQCAAEKDVYREWFIRGTEPTTFCEVHRPASTPEPDTANNSGQAGEDQSPSPASPIMPYSPIRQGP